MIESLKLSVILKIFKKNLLLWCFLWKLLILLGLEILQMFILQELGKIFKSIEHFGGTKRFGNSLIF